MAKSKNHTNHNQNYKAHRNGIKKPARVRWISTKGVRSHRLPLQLLPEGALPSAPKPNAPPLAAAGRALDARARPTAQQSLTKPLRCPQMDPKFLRNQRAAKRKQEALRKAGTLNKK